MLPHAVEFDPLLSHSCNKSSVRLPLPKATITRISQIGLATVSLALVVFLSLGVYQASKLRVLRVVAGSATGDSYILCAALKKVVERHSSHVRIDVVET